MASKKSSSKSTKSAAKAVSSTAIRNTAIPKVSAAPAPVAAPAKMQITHDAIALRAFEIWSSRGGDEQSNWAQAEAELRSAA